MCEHKGLIKHVCLVLVDMVSIRLNDILFGIISGFLIFTVHLIGILLTKIHILMKFSMRAYTAHNYIVIYTPI